MQIFPIHHAPESRIAHTQLAGNAEISVTSQGLCHLSSIKLKFASLSRPNHVFQQLFILLQQATVAMIAQNAKKKRPCCLWDEPHSWWYLCAHAQALGRMCFQTTPTLQSSTLCAECCVSGESSSLEPCQLGQANESWASQAETHSSCAVLASPSPTRSKTSSNVCSQNVRSWSLSRSLSLMLWLSNLPWEMAAATPLCRSTLTSSTLAGFLHLLLVSHPSLSCSSSHGLGSEKTWRVRKTVKEDR